MFSPLTDICCYCKNVPISLPQVGNGSMDCVKSCIKLE